MPTRLFPRALVVLILAIAIVNAFAQYYYWYWTMRWFDMPMHFAGGMWLAGVAIWWRFFAGRSNPPEDGPRGNEKNLWLLLSWGVGAAFIVGLAWEAYEAVVALATKGYINAMSDTISDLGFDILGGLVVVAIVWLRISRKLKVKSL